MEEKIVFDVCGEAAKRIGEQNRCAYAEASTKYQKRIAEPFLDRI